MDSFIKAGSFTCGTFLQDLPKNNTASVYH